MQVEWYVSVSHWQGIPTDVIMVQRSPHAATVNLDHIDAREARDTGRAPLQIISQK